MLSVVLPYPPSELRPNHARRRHWASNSTTAAKFKADCAILCRASGLRKMDGDVRPHLTMTFCPATRARRDLDADLSSCKAMIDAISDAIGVDDQHFSYSLFRGEVVKGGEVRVVLTERII